MDHTGHGPESIRADDVSMQTRAELLPEAMREPFLWLGAYYRSECNRDADLLTERFRKVGVYHDKSTWIKILRGQWNRHPNGTMKESPVISESKFVEALQALRNNVRLEAMRGRVPFVETSTAKLIMSFLELKRMPERVNRFGVVIGPTGSQKTATFKEYERRHNHGLTHWLEAPENGSMSEFIGRLAESFGGPQKEPYDRKRRRIFASLSPAKMVIVDNCQRLYREQRGSDQPLFSFLQRVQDETDCTIILSITPTFERVLTAGMLQGYFEQFEGRAGGRRNFLRLPEYAPEEDVVMIAKAFGLQSPDKHEAALVAISREPGRIRRLFEDLQSAKILAESVRERLTIAHVEQVRDDE